jgi:hypothetical protein
MPVTAKLSRKFYERLGDDVANELVEWFNQVDAAYRSEFRDLFEVHFARFDAKLEQRIAEVKAELESKFAGLEMKFGGLESTFGGLEARLDARMAKFEARIIKWMFLFWVGQAATTVGLVFGVVRLIGR